MAYGHDCHLGGVIREVTREAIGRRFESQLARSVCFFRTTFFLLFLARFMIFWMIYEKRFVEVAIVAGRLKTSYFQGRLGSRPYKLTISSNGRIEAAGPTTSTNAAYSSASAPWPDSAACSHSRCLAAPSALLGSRPAHAAAQLRQPALLVPLLPCSRRHLATPACPARMEVSVRETDRARRPLGGTSTFGQFERASTSRILLEYFLSGTAPFYSFRNQTSMKAGWIGSIPVRSSTQRIISQSTKSSSI